MATGMKNPFLPNYGGTGKTSMASSGFLKDFYGNQSGSSSPYASNPAPAPLPDFGQILAQDPFYQAALAGLNAQGVSDKASRDAAMRQAYIRFGDAGPNVDLSFLPPELRAEVSGIITPDVRGLAKQNDTAGLSILARLKDAAQQTAKRTTDVLGSRGMFRTGETGYQFGRNQLYSSQAQYDATNKFLDYIMGVNAAYVQAERQRQALLLQQQQEAANRGGTAPSTTYNPGPPGGINQSPTGGNNGNNPAPGGGPLHGGGNPWNAPIPNNGEMYLPDEFIPDYNGGPTEPAALDWIKKNIYGKTMYA